MSDIPQLIPREALQRISNLSEGSVCYVIAHSDEVMSQVLDALKIPSAIRNRFKRLTRPEDLKGLHQPIVLIAPNWWMGGYKGMEQILEDTQASVYKVSFFRQQVLQAQREAHQTEENMRRRYTDGELPASGHSQQAELMDHQQFLEWEKKPVHVEAIMWDGSLGVLRAVKDRGAQVTVSGIPRHEQGIYTGLELWNELSEKWVKCHMGWMIVRHPDRYFYACSPDVFQAEYQRPDKDDLLQRYTAAALKLQSF